MCLFIFSENVTRMLKGKFAQKIDHYSESHLLIALLQSCYIIAKKEEKIFCSQEYLLHFSIIPLFILYRYCCIAQPLLICFARNKNNTLSQTIFQGKLSYSFLFLFLGEKIVQNMHKKKMVSSWGKIFMLGFLFQYHQIVLKSPEFCQTVCIIE